MFSHTTSTLTCCHPIIGAANSAVDTQAPQGHFCADNPSFFQHSPRLQATDGDVFMGIWWFDSYSKLFFKWLYDSLMPVGPLPVDLFINDTNRCRMIWRRREILPSITGISCSFWLRWLWYWCWCWVTSNPSISHQYFQFATDIPNWVPVFHKSPMNSIRCSCCNQSQVANPVPVPVAVPVATSVLLSKVLLQQPRP